MSIEFIQTVYNRCSGARAEWTNKAYHEVNGIAKVKVKGMLSNGSEKLPLYFYTHAVNQKCINKALWTSCRQSAKNVWVDFYRELKKRIPRSFLWPFYEQSKGVLWGSANPMSGQFVQSGWVVWMWNASPLSRQDVVKISNITVSCCKGTNFLPTWNNTTARKRLPKDCQKLRYLLFV